ncbi:MAG: aspartyl/asparaginyl beta-hydroxylase domain-containing protein [Bacteroidia bacterium]
MSIWFSVFDNKEYVSNDPPFADISSIKQIENLERNYKTILAELQQYITANEMESHFNVTMVEKPKTWKVRSLRVWGVEMYEVQKHFQKTMALLNDIPNVINIGFNLLEPQAKIKPHSGDTNAITRCHLGLKIPAGQPTCAIMVKNEVRGWQEGKAIGFIDAYPHEAWNLSTEKRIILLFDILQPTYVKQKNKICATILTSLYLQNIGNRFQSLYKTNRKKFKLILYPFILFLQLAIPLRNRIKSRG